MNTSEAYEQHTAYVRALAAKGTHERGWFDYRMRHMAYNPITLTTQEMLSVADPDLLLREADATTGVPTSIILGYEVNDPAPEGAQGDVGVVDLGRIEQAAQGDVPKDVADLPIQVAVPLHLLADITAKQLASAQTFYVTADMVTLLEHAATVLDDTDVMPRHPDHPTGFVVLARPLRLPYGDGTDEVVHAFAWTDLGVVRTNLGSAGHAGFLYQFGVKRDTGQDREVRYASEFYPSKRAWKDAPDLVPIITDNFVTGASVGQAATPWDVVEQRRLDLAEAVGVTPAPGKDKNKGPEPVGRFQPYLAAFLLLLTQQITAPRQERVNEYAQGRARRAGRTQRGGRTPEAVTVVDVRPRPASVPGERTEGGQPRYDHRHLVGGHWKWQPWGPARQLRRRIFVEPYIRGPQDTPLVTKPRVVRL